MMLRNSAIILGLAVTLASCASPTISPKYQLRTVETEDESKRFTYGFSARRSALGSGGEAPTRGAGRQRRDRGASFADMRKELETYMEITRYCSEGYFVFDESFDGNEYLLHGECQESKTE